MTVTPAPPTERDDLLRKSSAYEERASATH